jgi:sugar/nucleoside kinase (ribokinase family)
VFFMDFLAEPVPVELARKVKAAGVPIVADVEGRHSGVGELCELIDYLVVSEEFAQWVSGERDLKAACAKLAQCPRKATVVTAGANGCWWTDSPGWPPVHVPAFKIDAVDTTGCGDTYHGAFAFGVAKNFSVEETVVLASACGALKATGRGWSAMPTRESLGAFLRERKGHHPAVSGVLAKLG